MKEKTINLIGTIAIIVTIILVLSANGAFATTASGGGGGGGIATNVTAPSSGGAGGGGGAVNVTEEEEVPVAPEECPAFYTCPDGTQVPWCYEDRIDEEGEAACACIISPETQCPQEPVMIPSVDIITPRHGELVSGLTEIIVSGIGENEEIDLEVSVEDNTGTHTLTAYGCTITAIAPTCVVEEVPATTTIASGPVSGGGIGIGCEVDVVETIYEKNCHYNYDFSNTDREARIAFAASDIHGGSAGSIVVFTKSDFIKNTLTLVVKDAYTSSPIEGALVTATTQTILCEEIIVEEPGVPVNVTAVTVAVGGVVAEAETVAVGGGGGRGIAAPICGVGGVMFRGYTDEDGKLTFEVEPGVTYTVQISASGYVDRIITDLTIDYDVPSDIGITKVIYMEPIGAINVTRPPIEEPIRPPPFPGEEVIVTLKFNTGWNLISLPGKYVEGAGSTCTARDPIAFVYLKDEGRYVTLQEAMDMLGEENLKEYLSENAFWVYSYENCEVRFEVEEYSTFNHIDLVRGWNLVPITVDVEGLALDDIEGSCDFESSYLWDSTEQEWETLSSTKEFTSSDLYKGVLLKPSNACTLGGARLG